MGYVLTRLKGLEESPSSSLSFPLAVAIPSGARERREEERGEKEGIKRRGIRQRRRK